MSITLLLLLSVGRQRDTVSRNVIAYHQVGADGVVRHHQRLLLQQPTIRHHPEARYLLRPTATYVKQRCILQLEQIILSFTFFLSDADYQINFIYLPQIFINKPISSSNFWTGYIPQYYKDVEKYLYKTNLNGKLHKKQRSKAYSYTSGHICGSIAHSSYVVNIKMHKSLLLSTALPLKTSQHRHHCISQEESQSYTPQNLPKNWKITE